ncbi:hypothetical protein Tco_1427312, partial [Tanacetum coccineum]
VEFEASKPSSTRTVSSYSPVSLDSTAPLSPDHPLTYVSPTPTPTRVLFHRRTVHMTIRTQPTLSQGMSARIVETAALSLPSFHTDNEGDELGEEDTTKDESSDANDEREGQDLDDDGQGLDNDRERAFRSWIRATRRRALESIEEIAPSTYEVRQSSRSVPEKEGVERIFAFRQPTLVTWVDPEDDRVYTDIPAYAPPAAPIQTLPSLKWSLATILVDKDQFIEVGVQLELHESILHDHTQRLDALPPTLVADIDRDVRELYTRSGAAGQTDAQRAALWHAIYDIQRENHDLRRQLAEERRERLELTDRVARIKRRQEYRGE